MGIFLFLAVPNSLRFDQITEAMVVAALGTTALLAGIAELLHHRTRWSTLVGLQAATLVIPATALIAGLSYYLAAEITALLGLILPILFICWLLPLVYLFRPSTRRALRS
jgi:hypothetical protein